MATAKPKPEDILEALAAPTPKSEVKTRPGKGGSGDLSYIDARFVFDRFDSAVGPANWQVEIVWTPDVFSPERKNRSGRVISPAITTAYPMAKIGVKLGDEWVWRQDIGTPSDIEGVKGSVSDSIKRAAVQWGVARDLYDPTSEVYQDVEVVAEEAEKRVVGQSGLSSKQKALLAVTFKEAGIPDDQRRAVIWLIVQKQSSKQLNNEELDTILDVLRNPDQHADHWENIRMLEGVSE